MTKGTDDSKKPTGHTVMHGLLMRCCCMMLGCLLLHAGAGAQRVSATLDREKILLGEQVVLKLTAADIDKKNTPVSGWFVVPDTMNHIEVVRRAPIDTLDLGSTITYTQLLTLTSFDSGRWVMPPFALYLQDSSRARLTDALTIEVLPVDVSSLQEYHPMKDIVEVMVKQSWIRYLVLALVVAVVAALMYFFIRKKRKITPVVRPAARSSLFEETIAQLEALQKENLPPVIFYSRLNEICRSYIQAQLHLRTQHLTQDELMIKLKGYLPQQEAVSGSFYQLLRLISIVKFARYMPHAGQQADSIRAAKAAVQYLYHQVQSANRQHAS